MGIGSWRARARFTARVVGLAALVSLGGMALAADGTEERELLVSTHARLAFDRDFARVAVANPDVVSFEPLSEREGLVLGRELGRTSLMVWFADGSTRSYLFHVRRDLSLLEAALREVAGVDQVAVVGNRRRHLAALLTLTEDAQASAEGRAGFEAALRARLAE